MASVIQKDLHRYGRLKGTKGFWKGMMIPGFRYTFFLRKAAGSAKYSLPGIFYRMMLKRYSYKYGFQIPVGATIGEGFYLGHFGAIVINPKVIIGRNCNIAQGVTLGQINLGPKKGCPVVGDYVWIGTNAVIVGKVTIGNNVLIAPNSYVNFDVPPNTIVIGNPAKMIDKPNPVEGYIVYVMEEK